MKITKYIHRFVAATNAEEFFVRLRNRVNVVRKFIPVAIRHKFTSIGRFIPDSATYPKDDSYELMRDQTNFKINRSDYVQWRIFYGVRDNALLEAKRHVQNDSIILDIGANFGAFALRLARFATDKNRKNFQVHAFEPNPDVQRNFEYNLALNPELQSVVRLHQVGLGDETGKRIFAVDDINSGAGRIMSSENPGQFTVKIQRLDDFISELNPPHIAFIKLIVEGFEPEVLKGGWNTIQKYKPPVFMEVTPTWWSEHGHQVDEVVNKLAGLGYRFRIEHHNEMLPYEPVKYASRFQFNLMGTVESNLNS